MAPIILFTYKRLKTLQFTISKLLLNAEVIDTDLFVFSDGPNTDDEIEIVNKVSEYLKTINGFKSITLSFSPTHNGLANSVISGVTKVFAFSEDVIVLEDDLEVTSDFLYFMNQCLAKYRNSPKVFSISGYSLPFQHNNNTPFDVYFLKRGWSWGWASWRDRWVGIDWDVKDYLSFIKDDVSQRRFSLGGSDLNQMLAKQMHGKIDSWAIRWFYHQFKISGLTIYPLYSKVNNRGFDSFATNTLGSYRRYKSKSNLTPSSKKIHFPDIVATNPYYMKQFLNKMSLKARLVSKIESILKKSFLYRWLR